MYKKFQLIAQIVALVILIGLWSHRITIQVADTILVPCSILIAWRSAKYTKSWVIAQVLIGLSVGVTAVMSLLDRQIIFTLWTFAIASIAEGVRVALTIKQSLKDQALWGGWYKDHDWPSESDDNKKT